MAEFSLDVDLFQLGAVKMQLDTLAGHLTTHSEQCSAAPGDIGSSWTGAAATAIKTEMTGLGTETKQFAPKFAQAADAVGAFINKINSALEDVASFNKQWTQANAQATADIKKAQTTHDQTVAGLASGDTAGQKTAADALGSAKGLAATSLRYEGQSLQYQFQLTRQAVQGAAQTLSAALHGATVVPVPDQTVSAYNNGSLPSNLLAALERSATDTLGGSLHLPEDKQSAGDGTAAAANFNKFFSTGPHSKADVEAFLATLQPGSAAFRQAFLAHLDLKVLVFLQQVSHEGVDQNGATEYGKVVTAVSQMMAKGSNATQQGVYPVPSTFYDDWRSSYAKLPNPDQGKFYIAEIVQAGQGNGATWDTSLITSIGKDLIAYEQQRKKEDPEFSWSGVVFPGYLTTAAEQNMFGKISGQADPLSMMFDALQHDATASQDVLLKNDGTVDTDLLHYLYAGRTDRGAYAWATSLGGVLNAATTFVGTGGPGTQDYNSAEIVGDLVHYFGEHPNDVPMGMEQSIVDILCHHIQDLNNANPADISKVGLVTTGDPSAIFARQRLTTAVITDEDLNGLLSRVFQLDYYADKGRPLYQQLSATQIAAFHQDFLTAVAAGSAAPPGTLQSLAGRQGEQTTGLITDLTNALKSQGASADDANASAREAADWVFGLATDKIPVDDLGGPAGAVAGLGVDAIKDWALDQLFPTTDYEAKAAAEGATLDKLNKVQGALLFLNWSDEAGILPPDASAASWAHSHPGSSSFITTGPNGQPTIENIPQLYQHRGDNAQTEKAWNDFQTYWSEAGDPYLRKTDLYEDFELSALSGI